MKGSSLVFTISLLSILSVSILSAVPNDAYAQAEQFDYRCYETDFVIPTFEDGNLIKLDDQFFGEEGPFGPAQIHTLSQTLEFCNPATKVEPNDPEDSPLAILPHLRCYQIDNAGGTLDISVNVLDQFFPTPHEHNIGPAVEYCHTVTKDGGTLPNGEGYPGSLQGMTGQVAVVIQNWKCYEITGGTAPLDPTRDLIDQFVLAANPQGGTIDPRFPADIVIGDAILLCNPAIKNYNPNLADEPSDLDNHIICYEILNQATFTTPETIGLADQHTEDDSDVVKLEKICTDGVKTFDIAGTFIPLDSIAILLAGAHMSSAWILPALVAISGVAFGIDIARKYRKDTK